MKKNKAIGSISSYLKALKIIPLEENMVRFYRGHSELKWKLDPSLFRKQNKIFYEKELEILKELHIHYPDSFSDSRNLFEDLVIAQHYGVPTRLLDVTTNPLVALYFAVSVKKPKTGNAIVYIIDICKDSIVYYDNSEMLDSLKNSIEHITPVKKYPIVGVKARLNNPRIIRQQGAFLYFSEFNNNQDVIKDTFKIEISKSHIAQIKVDLSTLGISTQTLFPELTEFSKGIHNGEIKL